MHARALSLTLAALCAGCAHSGESRPRGGPAGPVVARDAAAVTARPAPDGDRDPARDAAIAASASALDAGLAPLDASASAPFAWALRPGGPYPTRDDALAPGARAAFAFSVDADSNGQRDEVVLVRAGDAAHAGTQLVALALASDAGWTLAPLFVGAVGRHEVSAAQAFIVRRVPFVLLEVRDRDAAGAGSDAGRPDGGASDRYSYRVLRFAGPADATDAGAAIRAIEDDSIVPGSGLVPVLSLAAPGGAEATFNAPAPDGTIVLSTGRRQCTLTFNGTRLTATRWGGAEAPPPRRRIVQLEWSRLP